MSGVVNAIFGGGGSTAAAPDYTPVANASAEAAKLSTDLGREQLAENKRQFEANMAVARPIIDKQSALMDQTKAQGDDYFNYMKTFRPAEQQMLADANDPEAKAADAAERAAIAGSDTQVYDANKADIEANVGRAVADSQGGYTRALQQIARQGMRYGMTPGGVSSQAAALGMQQASATAGAANTARTQGIADVRNRMTTNRNMRIQDQSTNWAKRLDSVGIAKGLSGASQGAYSLANQSGNSAVANQNGTAAQYINGMNAGTSTIMQGQGQKIQGLTGVMNTQAGVYNNSVNNATAERGQNMDFMGSAAGMAMGAMAFSDRRLKRDIRKIGDDPRGFGWYEYEYVWGGGRRVGVMAQEVAPIIPGAVADVGGYLAVDYSAL